MKVEEMEIGKAYYISFGGTQLVGRYKGSDTCNLFFYANLHYWSGYENFHTNTYCVKAGIEELRRATAPEIHNLIRFEIEHGTI